MLKCDFKNGYTGRIRLKGGSDGWPTNQDCADHDYGGVHLEKNE